jgi:hypothetical protein
MAGRVLAYPGHPPPGSVGPPWMLYNRRCVGGRDTPGHDDSGKFVSCEMRPAMTERAGHDGMSRQLR